MSDIPPEYPAATPDHSATPRAFYNEILPDKVPPPAPESPYE